MKSSKASTTSFRFSEEDHRLIDMLRQKMGVSAKAEILRMGLHVLAAQHGLKT